MTSLTVACLSHTHLPPLQICCIAAVRFPACDVAVLLRPFQQVLSFYYRYMATGDALTDIMAMSEVCCVCVYVRARARARIASPHSFI